MMQNYFLSDLKEFYLIIMTYIFIFGFAFCLKHKTTYNNNDISVYRMYIPIFLGSKQAKALVMTSSGSVPLSFSPNRVRNMVKLIGPGASVIGQT